MDLLCLLSRGMKRLLKRLSMSSQMIRIHSPCWQTMDLHCLHFPGMKTRPRFLREPASLPMMIPFSSISMALRSITSVAVKRLLLSFCRYLTLILLMTVRCSMQQICLYLLRDMTRRYHSLRGWINLIMTRCSARQRRSKSLRETLMLPSPMQRLSPCVMMTSGSGRSWENASSGPGILLMPPPHLNGQSHSLLMIRCCLKPMEMRSGKAAGSMKLF